MAQKSKGVGSGGRNRRSLAGRGPTPKAEDRVYHKAHREKLSKVARGQARPKSGAKAVGADWVVGRNPVLEALNAGLPVKEVYIADGIDRDERVRSIFKYAAEHSLPLLQTTKLELDRLTGKSVHQGVGLRLPTFSYAAAEDLLAGPAHPSAGPLVVMLDSVTDPHNLGAIIRSAAAFGAAGVIIPERRSASVTATVWKSSAGAAARIPVAKCVNLTRTIKDYAKAGFMVIGLDGNGEVDISAAPGLDGPVALVVGSEGAGLSRLVAETCDILAAIPISSQVESLNASVAASIGLYEISRARNLAS